MRGWIEHYNHQPSRPASRYEALARTGRGGAERIQPGCLPDAVGVSTSNDGSLPRGRQVRVSLPYHTACLPTTFTIGVVIWLLGSKRNAPTILKLVITASYSRSKASTHSFLRTSQRPCSSPSHAPLTWTVYTEASRWFAAIRFSPPFQGDFPMTSYEVYELSNALACSGAALLFFYFWSTRG